MKVYSKKDIINVKEVNNINSKIFAINADIICLPDNIGSFFICKKLIFHCRDPPNSINFIKKRLEELIWW